MKLLPLGVGDAFTERHYTFCLAVEHEGEWILVDCPHPIRRILRDGGGPPAERISAVLLTHLHADHASGLEGLAYFLHFAAGRKLVLHAHPDVSARLWDGHLAAGMECILPAVGAKHEARTLADWVDLRPLPARVGPFEVECRRTIHHLPTTALRISAGGKSIGISADTAFDESLIAWLAEADLVVHETNHGVHTPYEKLASLPSALRAKMRLVHYPDSFDVERSEIECLRQGVAVEP